MRLPSSTASISPRGVGIMVAFVWTPRSARRLGRCGPGDPSKRLASGASTAFVSGTRGPRLSWAKPAARIERCR